MHGIPVAEIFGPTVQGEGPNVGVKCIFVRVAGCDFKCDWCDSKFSWDVKKEQYTGAIKLMNDLIKMCNDTSTRHVVFTGGNPCLYDLGIVVRGLTAQHIKVDVETQGSILPLWLGHIDTLVISPKPPSSNQPDVYHEVNEFIKGITLHKPKNIAIKIPIFDVCDIYFAERYASMIEAVRIEFEFEVKLYLSVGNDDVNELGDISDRILDNYRNLIACINDSNKFPNVYILPQVHTLLYGNKQGV